MKRDLDPHLASPPTRASACVLAPAPPVAASSPKPALRSRSGTVLTLQGRALAQPRYAAAALTVVTDLALLLGCDRVSIGFAGARGAQVDAMSGVADVDARQNLVRAVGAAMDEALDQRSAILYPQPGVASTVTLAHAELAMQGARGAVLTVPVLSSGAAVGALTFERREGLDASAVETAKDVAVFVAPLLLMKRQLDRPLAGRLMGSMRPALDAAQARARRRQHTAVGAAVALLLIGLAAWPVTFNVRAPARAEGAIQQVLAAPFDGFVSSVALRPGEPVKAGQLIASLDDRELALEREARAAELAQRDKQYRETLTREDAAQIVVARAKLDQAQAELDLVLRQIERAGLRAPFDGVLLSGDLSQSVGMPVKRGQELLTVAPDSSWRLVVEVDEQDIGWLREGQPAQVLFAAVGEGPVAMTVSRISPVASTSDGRNIFEVEGQVAQAPRGLRPGLRGWARIEIEQRALGWVWLHRAQGWLRRQVWRFLG